MKNIWHLIFWKGKIKEGFCWQFSGKTLKSNLINLFSFQKFRCDAIGYQRIFLVYELVPYSMPWEFCVSHFSPCTGLLYWSEYLLALNTLLFLYLLFSFLFVQLFENFSELEISPPKVNLVIWEASKAVSEEQDAIRWWCVQLKENAKHIFNAWTESRSVFKWRQDISWLLKAVNKHRWYHCCFRPIVIRLWGLPFNTL